MELERLADPHLVRNAELAEGDLARHGSLVGLRVELHPELTRAVRLGEEVSVRLDAVGEDDGATQVTGRVEAIR